MESVKGVIFGHDKNEHGHKYLIGLVLITDEPLDLVSPTGETVVMGGSPVNMLTPALQTLTKYKPPHCLGDLSNAIKDVAVLTHGRLAGIVRPAAIVVDEPAVAMFCGIAIDPCMRLSFSAAVRVVVFVDVLPPFSPLLEEERHAGGGTLVSQ